MDLLSVDFLGRQTVLSAETWAGLQALSLAVGRCPSPQLLIAGRVEDAFVEPPTASIAAPCAEDRSVGTARPCTASPAALRPGAAGPDRPWSPQAQRSTLGGADELTACSHVWDRLRVQSARSKARRCLQQSFYQTTQGDILALPRSRIGSVSREAASASRIALTTLMLVFAAALPPSCREPGAAPRTRRRRRARGQQPRESKRTARQIRQRGLCRGRRLFRRFRVRLPGAPSRDRPILVFRRTPPSGRAAPAHQGLRASSLPAASMDTDSGLDFSIGDWPTPQLSATIDTKGVWYERADYGERCRPRRPG